MDNLRRFLVVFCIMLMLAAAVCGVMLVRSYNDSNKKLVEDLEVTVPTYDPSGEKIQNSFQNNILFVVYDEHDLKTQMMFIMNVDTVSRTLNFMLLPRELKFNVSNANIVGSFEDMYGLFASSRGASCASAIASYFEIDVNYYFCITTDEMAKFINSFCTEDNGVIFDVPLDVYYRDFDRNISINYKRGSQYLKGEDAVNFLTFYKTSDGFYSVEMLNYYDGTDSKRMTIVARFIDAFISQKFFEASSDYYLRSFTELAAPYLRKCDTNVNESMLGIIAQILGVTNSQKIGYFMPLGDLSFNEKMYLEYNGYVRNLVLDENISPSIASEIFESRFKTIY